MGPIAAYKLSRIVENLAGVLAIESLCAAQALDFHRPLKSSSTIEQAHALLRTRIPIWEEDRYLHTDLEAAKASLMEIGELARLLFGEG
jgi:histidine ammonia-lyase